MRTALVGCGKIADAHVSALARLPHLATLAAVCDSEALMAEQLAARFGIAHRYVDFAALLASVKPDVVHITTPPASHLALATEALDAGCHVYVEKPLTTRKEDDITLLDHARACGRKLTIGYTYAFDPVAEELRAAVRHGRLGDVVHAESIYGYDRTSDYGAAASRDRSHWVHGLRGGLLRNSIDHMLNELVEWLPEEGADVTATAPSACSSDDTLGPPELRLLLRGRETTASALFSSRARPAVHRLTLYGTRDTATADFHSRTIVYASTGRQRSSLGRALSPFWEAAASTGRGVRNVRDFARARFGFFEGMVELMSRFYSSIAAGTPPPISDRRMRRVAYLADEAMAQLEAVAGRERQPCAHS